MKGLFTIDNEEDRDLVCSCQPFSPIVTPTVTSAIPTPDTSQVPGATFLYLWIWRDTHWRVKTGLP